MKYIADEQNLKNYDAIIKPKESLPVMFGITQSDDQWSVDPVWDFDFVGNNGRIINSGFLMFNFVYR